VSILSFPEHFIWGTSTAAYQIEGAAREDGRGPSVWDMACRHQKIVWNGQTGDTACDHYHRWREDIGLMKEIGIRAYRMSISWTRLFPDGRGPINQKGLDFYRRLTDTLVQNGITPYITLFHWDFPYSLYQKGGLLNSDSPEWFAEYAGAAVAQLSGTVKNWITLNEPQCYIDLGHRTGSHAPGLRLPMNEVLLTGHHLLLAHGKMVLAMRAAAKQPLKIGIAEACGVACPEKPEDTEVARSATFSIRPEDTFNNAWWTDPVFFGAYPEDGLKAYEKDLPPIGPDDLKTIGQPIDFLGQNIYHGTVVRKGADGKAELVTEKPGADQTDMGWYVVPQSLYWGPRFFWERYRKPIIISENGAAITDWVSEDGRVHDPQRIEFMRRYLKENLRAIRDGADVRGYFYWSLLDNFEWDKGYSKRFGLVHVDYETQERRVKDSGRWYRGVINSNGGNL
jgi:beta-glucosidase